MVESGIAQARAADGPLRQDAKQYAKAHGLAHAEDSDIRIRRLVHALNTPVGASTMAASLLPVQIDRIASELDTACLNRIAPLLEEWREASTRVQSSLQQCIQILGNAAPPQPSPGTPTPPLMDLQSTLKGAFLIHLARRPDLLVSCTLHFPDRLQMHGDSAVWQQVVGHLVDNSLLHGFAGRDQGAIEMSGTLLPGQRILMHYYDDGQGISKQARNRLLEHGFRTLQGQGRNGLALVQDLVHHKMGATWSCTGPSKAFTSA